MSLTQRHKACLRFIQNEADGTGAMRPMRVVRTMYHVACTTPTAGGWGGVRQGLVASMGQYLFVYYSHLSTSTPYPIKPSKNGLIFICFQNNYYPSYLYT